MKLVLLSGGSGKRLFPLSNEARSKQFLKVLPDKSGNRISMLQRVWGQVKEAGLENITWICAGKVHAESISSQAPDARIIQEPSSRDTFPAIVYSALYLREVVGISEDEVVVFMPIDPYVSDDFFRKLKTLEDTLTTSDIDIALLGVNPNSPSTKFGYIVPNCSEETPDWMKVKSFSEKPTEAKAEQLISEGALWNCGVFAFKISYLLKVLMNSNQPANYFAISSNFEFLPKISFDYEVVEKAAHVAVVPYNGSWEDIGTWDVLSKFIPDALIGKGKVIDSENTNVINELSTPVIVAGAKDMVVVASPDGILVADKHAAVNLKSYIEGLNSRPMYEERRWGTYRVLDYQTINGREVLTKHIILNEGKNISYQLHHHRSEVWTIIDGVGEFADDFGIRTVGQGDVLQIPVGHWHGLRAVTQLHFIEVQSGDMLVESDIIRRFMSWEEVESHFAPEIMNH